MATNNTLFVAMPLEEFQQLLIELIRTELKNFIKEIQIPNEEDLMNIDEAKALLKVSKPTIHKRIKEKILVSYRHGRRIYFKRHELISSLKESNSTPGSTNKIKSLNK